MSDFFDIQYYTQRNVSLRNLVGFHSGGCCNYFFEPESIEVLIKGLRYFRNNNIDIFILGKGRNVLVHDDGFQGAVVTLNKSEFCKITSEDNILSCGAGVSNRDLSLYAKENGISGFESFYCIPGSLGGSIRGNAGDKDKSICELIYKLFFIDDTFCVREVDAKDLIYEYRYFNMDQNDVITKVLLKGENLPPEKIAFEMDKKAAERNKTQPKGYSCGSIFKNTADYKAWQIVDKLGLRGFQVGGAKISEKHSNWIVSDGSATSSDVWVCVSTVREKAKKDLNIEMDLEIKLLGAFFQ